MVFFLNHECKCNKFKSASSIYNIISISKEILIRVILIYVITLANATVMQSVGSAGTCSAYPHCTAEFMWRNTVGCKDSMACLWNFEMVSFETAFYLFPMWIFVMIIIHSFAEKCQMLQTKVCVAN